MRKVNKEEFIRMPAGTLYINIVDGYNAFQDAPMIKLDTGFEYETHFENKSQKHYTFDGAVQLMPNLPDSEDEGYITKYLNEYKLNEHIKGSWTSTDEAAADFNDTDEFLIFDEDEIKFMIKLLQTLCIDKDIDNKEISEVIN